MIDLGLLGRDVGWLRAGLHLRQLGARDLDARATDPGMLDAREVLGECLFHLGRTRDAVAALQAVLERDPERASAHLALARLYAAKASDGTFTRVFGCGLGGGWRRRVAAGCRAQHRAGQRHRAKRSLCGVQAHHVLRPRLYHRRRSQTRHVRAL